MFFSNELFTTHMLADPLTASVLQSAVEYTRGKVRPSDVLRAILSEGEEKVRMILAQSLEDGTTLEDIRTIIEIYNPVRIERNPVPKKSPDFSPETLAILEQFEVALQEIEQSQSEAVLLLLTFCVLTHLDAEDQENLTILQAVRCIALLREHIYGVQDKLPLFASPSGNLTETLFSQNAWHCLQMAAIYASRSGSTLLLPEHCLLGLLEEKESLTRQLVRMQQPPEIPQENVIQSIKANLHLPKRDVAPFPLGKEHMHEETQALLEVAQQTMSAWQHEMIETIHLLKGLLETASPRLILLFQERPMHIDLLKMRRHLEYQIQDIQAEAWRESPFDLPAALLPSEDLTYLAQMQGLSASISVGEHGQMISDTTQYAREEILQALHRREHNHVLITGESGVGKTTLVRDLAQRAAHGQIPALKQRRFIWVDCRDLSPQESKNKLVQLLTAISGHKHLLICLDGMSAFFRAETKQENILLLRRALREQQLQLIGIISTREFEELLSPEQEFLEFFTRVRVVEPDEAATFAILKLVSTELEREYQLQLDERVIERAFMLATNYMLSERHPAKSIKILRQACELIDYERRAHSQSQTAVRVEDIVRVAVRLTGLPEETLTGITKKADYEHDLAEFVVGQDEAVKSVAMELRRIKAGWTDASKPASVLLFAGLTGVGKTELAKALARFYSSSRRLQTYTMANFTEPHSVSGIIGVPPGYIGYDQGGRLINDLNADPYCVFLLDEAEKAHPEVWKPFLNLFDEAWITDTHGTRAYADKAIFILTSNAGSEIIAQMWLAGERDMSKIAERVKSALGKIRHERSEQPVFSPEFIARIRQIIIFRPLDLSAMEAICRKHLVKMQQAWKQKREKTLVVPEMLIQYIAEYSHRRNQRSGNKEGGRIVERLLSHLIEDQIQFEQMRDKDAYQMAEIIEITCDLQLNKPSVYDSLPPVRVMFHRRSSNR